MTLERLHTVLGLLVGLLLLIALAGALLFREAARRDLEAHLYAVLRAPDAPGARGLRGSASALAGLLRRLGEAIRRGTRLYSEADLAALEGAIGAAGFDPRRVLPALLGLKLVLLVLVPPVAYAGCAIFGASALTRGLAAAAALPIGLLGPDWIIRLMQRPYVRALQRGVIDAIDLLVVCTEAGMGLEGALDTVSREMRHANPAMANALGTLLDELRVLPDRREALANFASRSPVDGLRRLGTMLGQTMQYGTPLGQALRSVAGDLRRDRVIRLEERAVRLPAMLVFPLIVFIMPSVFIVMGGVPILRLLDMFAATTGGHGGG